jgi:hypothetical protein
VTTEPSAKPTKTMRSLFSSHCIEPRVVSRGSRGRKTQQYLALLIVGALASSATAGKKPETPQQGSPLTYNDGDLFLGFRATDRTNDYLINIGQPSPFLTAAPGSTFSVGVGTPSADLAAVFGSDWYTRIDPNTGNSAVRWAIVGGREIASGNEPEQTLYSTNPGSTSWPPHSPTGQSITTSLIASMGNEYAGNNPSPNNTLGLVQSATATNSYATFQPPGANSGGISFQTWNPNDEGAPSDVLYLDRIAPSACGTALGTLTMDSTGHISFTAVSIPAPVTISGKVDYCSNPSIPPVPNVTVTLTGSMSGSTLTDSLGNFSFPSLPSGGNYLISPSKAGLPPGSSGISTIDVIGTQRYFLGIGPPLVGCRLTAADVNGINGVNTVDVIAIQRFFLALSTGIANVGKYQFSPASRSFFGVFCDRASQNFDSLVFGDIASGFVHRPAGGSGEDGDVDSSIGQAPTKVATLTLPEGDVDASMVHFVADVTTTTINPTDNLVGFQGDLNFDERVVTFETVPVEKAGLTAGNWNVSGNVLPGQGPFRTLRISAYSNDFAPLSGTGTLFELRMIRVGKTSQSAQLVWAESPNQFIFIDADLNPQIPSNAQPGVLTLSSNQH